MKKLLIIIAIFIWTISTTLAEGEKESSEATTVKVNVWTYIPNAWCVAKRDEKWTIVAYECNVPKSSSWVVKYLWDIIKWFTFITLLASVLFIVINWIMYSMGWIDPELKNKAKERIIKTIIWIIILFSAWYILTTIAPWIYK